VWSRGLINSTTVAAHLIKLYTYKMSNKKRSRIAILLSVLFILCAGTLYGNGNAESFEEALEPIYSGRSNNISQAELMSLMEDGVIGKEVFLLDIRSQEEWDVSRLQGAQYIGYNEFSIEAVSHIPQEAAVILYCAVGWRSGRVGNNMQKAGYTNLRDLYGSLW